MINLNKFNLQAAEVDKQRTTLQSEVNERMIEFNQLKNQLYQIKVSFEGEELLKGDEVCIKYEMNDQLIAMSLFVSAG